MVLVEFFYDGKPLAAMRGELRSFSDDFPVHTLTLTTKDPAIHDARPFSPASCGVATVDDILTGRDLVVMFYVMDAATGVIATLFEMSLDHESGEIEVHDGMAVITCGIPSVPVTSMTYAGPPLQAEVSVHGTLLAYGRHKRNPRRWLVVYARVL